MIFLYIQEFGKSHCDVFNRLNIMFGNVDRKKKAIAKSQKKKKYIKLLLYATHFVVSKI